MRSLHLPLLTVLLLLIASACASGDMPDAQGDDRGDLLGEDAGPPTDSFADAGPLPDADTTTCGEEICGDGIDNNCNDQIDESCGCEPSSSAECYTGAADTRHVGACRDGSMTCYGQDEITLWGSCEGSVLPGVEVCDADGVDEDCDGTVNEDCQCVPGQSLSCGSDVGECQSGVQECINGALGQCTGAVGPSVELCDNLDNDCDGEVDENLVQACGNTTGACTAGESVCKEGQWGACEGGIGPVGESCDTVDNDCDGSTDEDTEIVCGSDEGSCSTGYSFCIAGSYGACTGNTDSMPETCDNEDNDCDGSTDEDIVEVCGSSLGVCSTGTRSCSAGSFGDCVGSVGPNTSSDNESPGFCDGALDDDCDGLVDEGCACIDGSTSQCGSAVGECEYGTQTCAGGTFGSCEGGTGPSAEICDNGLDEDCNGIADDGCPGTDPPILSCGGSISSEPLQTVAVSANGSDPDGGAVSYLWTVTSAPAGSTSQPASPTSATTTFFLDLAGDYELTVTVTDDDGDTASCVVQISAIPSQDLHIELLWDSSYGDVDLHLLRPGLSATSDWYSVGFPNAEHDCFFGNKTASWPPNGGAGNATLDIDDKDGFGPENINIDDTPSDGTYHIGVAYFCQHSLGAGNIDPGSGPTNATVRVYCGGVMTDEYSFGLQETGEFIHVADVTWPGCAGSSVMNEMYTAEIQPAAFSTPLHCAISCTSDNDCTPGEVCGSNGQCALD